MTTASENQTNTQRARPVHIERLGWVQASVWKREGKRGVFFELSLRRGYPGMDGKVKYTSAFHLRDLQDLATVLTRAGDAMKAMTTGTARTEPNPEGSENPEGVGGQEARGSTP